MESDMELLELAARAAGLATRPDWYDPLLGVAVVQDDHATAHRWNPLESDADAFRLAVKLNLMIVVRPSDVRCNAWGSTNKRREFLTSKTDPYAATRRAIVRAAAAIARSQHE